MPARLRDRAAVLRACAEYDRLGPEQFLAEHGFGPATKYLLRVDAKLYDSKAIVGVAYGYEHPGQGPLSNAAFSGGVAEGAAAWQLRRLGFDVVERPAP